MASCIGSKVKLKTNDGEYCGILQALGENYGRVTLQDVTNLQSGTKLKGLLHFFKNEIQEIAVVEEKKGSRVLSDDSQGRKIMGRKMIPAHLKKLKDPDREKLFLKGRSSGDETSPVKVNGQESSNRDAQTPCEVTPEDAARVAKIIGQYVVIDTLEDDSFTEAIEHLNQQTIVGLAAEGLKMGRNGQLCWLAFSTKQYTLLFDILTMGEKCFREGLADVLSSHIVQKVIHDCRALSDLLHHQYDIQMVNVFDTQVADNVIFCLEQGCWPHFVRGLHVLLFEYLQLDTSLVYVRRYRDEQDDEKVWAMRPSGSDTINALLKSVVFLCQLRIQLMERMLRTFNRGVDIYLNTLRDSSGLEYESQQKTRHQLPKDFKNLAIQRENNLRDPSLFDDNRFYLNCDGVMDPEVQFSLRGINRKGDGLMPVSFPDNVRARARARTRNKERETERSTSSGRRSASSTREQKITQMGSPLIKKTDKIPKAEPPIPAHTLSPEDNIFLTSEALGGSEIGMGLHSQTEVNFIASGCESKVGVPKLSQRVKDPMKKCNFSENESNDEYHIISTRSPLSSVNTLPEKSMTTSLSEPPSVNLSTVSKPMDSPPVLGRGSLPQYSPKVNESPTAVGRGDLLRNLEQLKGSKDLKELSPGGLQNRLPQSQLPASASGTGYRDHETGYQNGDLDLSGGGISMGRGRLKQRYDAL